MNMEIPTNRWYHITCYAGTLGLIAMWPYISTHHSKKPEHAYILLEERVTDHRDISWDAALAELTRRYFCSHGPATLDDFARRSGLTKTQIKSGIQMCGNTLEHIEIDGRNYIYTHCKNDIIKWGWVLLWNRCKLLPAFDEFLLWYKDRSATVDHEHLSLIDKARNWVMKPTFMIDGKTLGIRKIKKRTRQRDIYIQAFDTLTQPQKSLLEEQVYMYGKFVNMELCIEYI